MGLFNKNKIKIPEVSGAPNAGKINSIIGIGAACKKDPKKIRSDILKKLKIGSPLIIERNGSHYYVVDVKTGLDIGELKPDNAKYLSESYPDAVFIGELYDNAKNRTSIKYLIYGERVSYSYLSRKQVNVIYRASKEKQITITSSNMNRLYSIADKDNPTEDDRLIITCARRVVEAIFEDELDAAQNFLDETFGEIK